MKKEVDPVISEYFRNLAKKRRDKNYGFNDPEVASRAGKKGRAIQLANRKKAKNE